MDRFTDLRVTRGAGGVYDVDLDEETADAGLDDGLYEAVFISLFTDRRAAADEVGNPMMRRGWIGDLLSDLPGDRIGSGLWLYSQSRLTDDVQAAIDGEARAALQWMVDDRLVSSVAVASVAIPERRELVLKVTLALKEGGVTEHAFVLANATRTGLLSNTGAAETMPAYVRRREMLSDDVSGADLTDIDEEISMEA